MRLSAVGFACVVLLPHCGLAQDAVIGIDVPVTVTGSTLYTHRRQEQDPSASRAASAFRTAAYPTLKLGPNWFGYAAIHAHSGPFFYEEADESWREVEGEVLQAFMGYSRSAGRKSFLAKAGRLTSAFGSFPLRYDDAANWLIDLPLSYGYYYRPVGLGHLTGAEVDAALANVDARFQVTDRSPATVTGSTPQERHLQWAGGAGYTISQGFRVGWSMYRGPYLNTQSRWLRPGELPKDSPATAVGIDVQWARGRWSVGGEWQQFRLTYPRVPAAVGTFGYGEGKVVLNPRFFVSARAGFRNYNLYFQESQAYEAVVGYRMNRMQLVKVGGELVRGSSISGTEDSVLSVQFITSIHSLSKALR